MINENEIIESGLLELYALGITDSRETELVERMVSLYPAVRSELEMVNDALLTEAIDQPVTPSPLVKPFLLATLNYNERLNNGYSPIYIPELTQDSKKEDFEQWVEVSYEGREEIYAHIFNLSPEAMSALIWLKSAVPEEIHHEQLESFFILEGSCEFTISGEVYHLNVGDYFRVPLHQAHSVRVTSTVPCKVILQRMAA